jgi:hypothetical protein
MAQLIYVPSKLAPFSSSPHCAILGICFFEFVPSTCIYAQKQTEKYWEKSEMKQQL